MSLPSILFLGDRESPILAYLRECGHRVRVADAPISRHCSAIRGVSWLVSHGYHHIVPANVLGIFPGQAINCHISLLPWNRGADPNLWSWVGSTPKGVTIHRMSEGLDKGEILAQQEVKFAEQEKQTLKGTYETLQSVLVSLFRVSWPSILAGGILSCPQRKLGSYHCAADRERIWRLLPLGWDTPVVCLHRLSDRHYDEARKTAQAGRAPRIGESLGAGRNNRATVSIESLAGVIG